MTKHFFSAKGCIGTWLHSIQTFQTFEIRRAITTQASSLEKRTIKVNRTFRKNILCDSIPKKPTRKPKTVPERTIRRSISSTSLPAERIGWFERMKCWVQFISTPTADTPGTSLLLHFDGKRYLIGNVAEGTQRACVQRKIRLQSLKDVFLTGTVGWANAGGILGMILSLADVLATSREETKRSQDEKRRRKGLQPEVVGEKQALNIHGGKNLTHMLATARRFVFRKGMPVHPHEFRADSEEKLKGWEPDFEDDKIKVWAMVLEPESHSVRKRSHDEFSDVPASTSSDGVMSPSSHIIISTTPDWKQKRDEKEKQDDEVRQNIVSDMFDSEWLRDTLVKKKLSEVDLPAAIFERDKDGKIVSYAGPLPNIDPSVGNREVLVRNPWPGATVASLPDSTPSNNSLCYIIKTHPQRGRFNREAAVSLGVVPGSSFRELTNGKSVTTPDGKVVTPEQVMGETKPGGGFAVVELPNESYIEPLLAREEWSEKELMAGVGAVIWMLGPGLVRDPRLQKFMRQNLDLKHIISSKDACSNYLALESPSSAAIRLHMIDSERFPLPKFSNEPKLEQPKNQSHQVLVARPGMKINLEPVFELKTDEVVPYLDTAAVVEDMRENLKEVLELADTARKEVQSAEFVAKLDENQKDLQMKDAEVIALGTGSALPSKYRNVSATLLRVPGHGSYLFDCGENTLGQLRRVLGSDLAAVLRDLKAIWISHLHADHHLGTASVIKAWAHETGKDGMWKSNRLVVASDGAMLKWLKEYSSMEDYGYDRIEPITMSPSMNYNHQFDSWKTKEFGLTSIEACPVSHCKGALATVFNFPNGFKVAYSGDCRPSSEFANIGYGASLLIHEATFDDELQGDAIAKKHSTTGEALEIGKQMNARRILLTHFSQRYQKIPVMDSHGGKDQVAIVAFDYMRVKLGDFAKLEPFKPALMKLLVEED